MLNTTHRCSFTSVACLALSLTLLLLMMHSSSPTIVNDQQFGEMISVQDRSRFYFNVFQDDDLLLIFNETHAASDEFAPFKFTAFELNTEKYDAYPSPQNSQYPSQQLLAVFQIFLQSFDPANENTIQSEQINAHPVNIELKCLYRIQEGLVNIYRDSIQMAYFNGSQFVDTFTHDTDRLEFTNLQIGNVLTFGLFATSFQPQFGENILVQYQSKFKFSLPPSELAQSWELALPSNNINPSYFALQLETPTLDKVPQGYVLVTAVKYVPSQPSPIIDLWDWRFNYNTQLGFQDVLTKKMAAIDPSTLSCACGQEGKPISVSTTAITLSNTTIYCLMGNLCQVIAIVAKPSSVNDISIASSQQEMKVQDGSLSYLKGMNYYKLKVGAKSNVAISIQSKSSPNGKLYIRKDEIPSPNSADDFLTFNNNFQKSLVISNDQNNEVVYYVAVEHVVESPQDHFDYTIGAYSITGNSNNSNGQLSDAQSIGIAFGITVCSMLVVFALVIALLVYCLRRPRKSHYINM
ncbi:hypothetical protein C9374_003879 [Naegleria lovaniensis]|uniref:Transmembrane protein n=1 Tax=Naegleria lovaniensis TaxID=51637 RepID=A0AA88H032_NAELO|nr:uncharacterized protein C9374_003879 [Naegleria lovaniensis]KAG2394115.1 hypothetical protein C9374_003879 [Naegleria lovaniensis]